MYLPMSVPLHVGGVMHGFAWCLSAGARQMHLWEEKGKKLIRANI